MRTRVMRRSTAYAWMAAIVVVLAATDYFVLTSSANLSRLARAELSKLFGDDLTCAEVRASMDGVLVLKDVAFQATSERIRVLSADRVEIRFSGGLGKKAETVLLDAPRLSLSDHLFEELAKMPPGPPLRERIGPDDLPRIVCRGGTLEIIHQAIFHADAPQAFEIRELSMSPTGPHRYAIVGRMESLVFGEWRLLGDVDLATETTRLTLECDKIYLGEKIKHVLNPSHVPEWERYKPDGWAAVRARFVKIPDRPLDFVMTLRALDLGMVYEGFPYPVDHVRGEIDFMADGFHIKYLEGRNGSTVFRFDGRSSGYATESDFKFRIQIENMPLDPLLFNALDKEGQAVWEDFHPMPSGRVDAIGWVMREYGPDKEVRIPLHLTFRDASILFRQFPYPVNNISGEVDIDGSRVTLKGLQASEPRWKMVPMLGWIPDRSTKFEIFGWVDGIGSEPQIYLKIHATALPLDVRLREALSADLQEIWEEYGPRGEIDVDWEVTKEKGKKEAVHRGTATLHRCKVAYKAFSKDHPLLMRDIEGQVRYSPEKIEFEHLQGRCNDAEVHLHGGQDDRTLSMRLEAIGLKLDPDVKKRMPKDVKDLLNTLELEGRANFDMDLRMPKDKKKEPTVSVSVEIFDGTIDSSLKIDKIEYARADLRVFVEEKGTRVYGPVRFSRAEIENKKVQDLSCTLSKEGENLRFLHIHGLGYGGVVTGSFEVNLESKEFGGDFRVDRLDLREFAGDTKSFSTKPPTGKASLDLRNLRGKGGETAAITGWGMLTITEANLFTVPLFLNVMDPLSWGESQVINAGTVVFDIKERKFNIHSAIFQGEKAALRGKGNIDFDGNYDLWFGFESGSVLGIDFFFFKGIARVMDLFRNAVLPIHRTGNITKPD